MERLPYPVATAAAAHERIAQLPVAIPPDNVGSLYNASASFRTANAAGVAAGCRYRNRTIGSRISRACQSMKRSLSSPGTFGCTPIQWNGFQPEFLSLDPSKFKTARGLTRKSMTR